MVIYGAYTVIYGAYTVWQGNHQIYRAYMAYTVHIYPYTVHIRCIYGAYTVWQGNHQIYRAYMAYTVHIWPYTVHIRCIYGHVRRIYTILANFGYAAFTCGDAHAQCSPRQLCERGQVCFIYVWLYTCPKKFILIDCIFPRLRFSGSSVHAHMQRHALVRMRTWPSANMHAQTHTHTHINMRTCTCTYVRTHLHTHMYRQQC